MNIYQDNVVEKSFKRLDILFKDSVQQTYELKVLLRKIKLLELQLDPEFSKKIY